MKNAIIQKLVVWSVVILTAGASARTIYVDPHQGPVEPNGPGGCFTIQAAINAAGDGDEVILADGIYTGWRNQDIDIDKTITLRSQNGPEKCIIDCNEDSKGYHYGFSIYGEEVTIEGISIINARSESGSAIIFWNNYGKGKIINCRLSGNSASEQGGAVYLDGNTYAEFYNCTFSNNSALAGGAVYCRGSLSLKNSVIRNNSAVNEHHYDNKGGGLFIEYRGNRQNIQIKNCSFSENSASSESIYKAPLGYGGAIYCQMYPDYDGTPVVLNVKYAEIGQMYSAYGSIPVSIENCRFNDNKVCGDRCAGAALYVEGSGSGGPRRPYDLILTDCSFLQNVAGNPETKYTNNTGGALYSEDSKLLLYKCVFQKNEAAEAAAMYLEGSKAVIVNCIVSGHAQMGTVKGSCVSFRNSDEQSMILRSTITGNVLYAIRSDNRVNPLIIRNSIIYGNNHPYGDYICQIYGYADVSYSCIQMGWEGVANIETDPCFIDAGHWDTNNTTNWQDDFWVEGNYRLKGSSLCLNAGCYPQYLLDSTDLDDKSRIVGEAIDMGPYENQLPDIKVKLYCVPGLLNVNSRYKTVIAMLTMPDGITPDDIDPDEPLLFEPGDVESKRQTVYQQKWCGKSCTCIMAFFDLSDSMEQFSDGQNKVTVKGKLKTGRCYFGCGTIRLVSWKWFQ